MKPVVQLPMSLLAGFAFEITLKAALHSQGPTDGQLRTLGHDLRAAVAAAKQQGYIPPSESGIEPVIEVMADAHESLAYRYIPDVEGIMTAKPDKLLRALAAHVDALEEQFEVWQVTLPKAHRG